MGRPAQPRPERFGRYRVTERLGAGAAGEVYAAQDETLGREVAIKVIRARGLGELAAAQFRARFEHEARALAGMQHPNVLQVFDLGVEGDDPYLVMELARGRALSERIETEGVLEPAAVRALGIQMCRALEASHKRGIVHRDVKPSNILEAEPGQWKLADFGVAHVPNSELTITGQFVGSPAFAAPEALVSGEFSPASDVYSLGATLYTALIGNPPYAGSRGGSLGTAQLARIADLRGDVPHGIASGVERALAREPEARPTLEGLVGELAELAPPASVPAAAPAVPAVSTALPAYGAAAPWWKRPGVLAGLAALLLLFIAAAIGSSGGEQARPAASVERPEEEPGFERDEKSQREFEHALEDLEYGDTRGALKHLDKVLERNPEDEEARELLEKVLEAEEEARWLPPGQRKHRKFKRHH